MRGRFQTILLFPLRHRLPVRMAGGGAALMRLRLASVLSGARALAVAAELRRRSDRRAGIPTQHFSSQPARLDPRQLGGIRQDEVRGDIEGLSRGMALGYGLPIGLANGMVQIELHGNVPSEDQGAFPM